MFKICKRMRGKNCPVRYAAVNVLNVLTINIKKRKEIL